MKAQQEAREVQERDKEIEHLGKTLNSNEDAFVLELERVFHKVRRHG